MQRKIKLYNAKKVITVPDENVITKKEEIETTRSKLDKKLARLSLINANLQHARQEFDKKIRTGNLTRFPIFDETHKQTINIQNLERQLVRIKKKHNTRVDASVQLKNEIDTYRKSLKGMHELLSKSQKEFEEEKKSYYSKLEKGYISNETPQRQLKNLMKSRILERSDFEETYLLLVRESLNNQNEMKKIKKNVSSLRSIASFNTKDMIPTKNLSIDNLAKQILDNSLENLSIRKSITNYKKKSQDLESTLHNIHTATGVSSIDEIIQSFKNVKKSNFNLLLVINSINTELNNLQIQNKTIITLVEEKKKELENRETSNKEMLKQQTLKLNDLLKKASEEDRKCDKLNDLLVNIESLLRLSCLDWNNYCERVIGGSRLANNNTGLENLKQLSQQSEKSFTVTHKSFIGTNDDTISVIEKIEDLFIGLVKIFKVLRKSELKEQTKIDTENYNKVVDNLKQEVSSEHSYQTANSFISSYDEFEKEIFDIMETRDFA